MIINLSKIDFGGVATGGGNAKPEEVFDVQPTTTDQTITPTEGSVFSGGTVRAVTKEIDVNIVSNNIKEGVTILGVAGALKAEKPEESFNVQPTTAEQTITPSEGSVFSGGTVKAVTSAIDNNIVAGNIKEGVTILGVAGALKGEKPEESFNVQPTTAEQTITPSAGSVFSGGTVKAVTSAIDSNIQPENIKEGVSILGVAGTLSTGGGSDVFVVPPEMRFGYSNFTEFPSNWDFSGFSNATDLSNMFAYCSKLTTIPPIDVSNVLNASGMFQNCSALTTAPSLNFSKVTDISNLFQYDNSLTSVPFFDTSNVLNASKLFNNCMHLKNIPQLNLSNATNVSDAFNYCGEITTIPPMDFSNVLNASQLFYCCSSLTTVPPLNTFKATRVDRIFGLCYNLTTVEGIDFSGLTSKPSVFGYGENFTKLTRFIVNGKINVSMGSYSIEKLTAIDYDSVKSILAAADRTDNTNAKTLAFNRTMTDQNGELAALVSSCTSKGWTITGLTIQ